MIKNRLKILLAERDMNLSDLAELAGIHYTTLRRFSTDGISSIHKETLSKICAALGVEPGDMFVYLPDKPTPDAAGFIENPDDGSDKYDHDW